MPICELIVKLTVITQININLELNQTHNSHSLRWVNSDSIHSRGVNSWVSTHLR